MNVENRMLCMLKKHLIQSTENLFIYLFYLFNYLFSTDQYKVITFAIVTNLS
jgi:hypothetical protein